MKEYLFNENIIRLYQKIHPLDRIPRSGFILRGVTEPESVSAHSHFVSLLTLLFVEEYPEMFNKEKALALALIHDLPEAIIMDIPMPASNEYLKTTKKQAEHSIFKDLFRGLPEKLTAFHKELEEKTSPEAKLVLGLDKAQMMLKILSYQKENRGNLKEFWKNPGNFRDYGLEPVSQLFNALCRAAGCERPVKANNRDFI